ncbi:hypothetical protein AWZ03_009994 [Drosophila navojoa]|uniref:Uncharacterized protein n=1 Tax=Drosophila navojoa TaxID=7232 RepID=A0A484B4I4_DRONA|nr:hypothetical protein AWZ03_009994 [Drosophila navojoa]
MVELRQHAVRQQHDSNSHSQSQSHSNSNSCNNNTKLNCRNRQLMRGSNRTKVKLKCRPSTTATSAATATVTATATEVTTATATSATATAPATESKKSFIATAATTTTAIAANAHINAAMDITYNNCNNNNCNTANRNSKHNSNTSSCPAATRTSNTCCWSTKMWLALPLLMCMLCACPHTDALRLTNGGNSLSKGVGANKEQLNIGLIAPHTNFGKREYLRSINNAVTGLTKTRGAKLTFLKDYSFEQKNIHFDMMSLTPSPTGK